MYDHTLLILISWVALAASENVLVCPKESLFEQRFDGMCNNQNEPHWGAHLAIKRRQTQALYQDEMDQMVTLDRPSARMISNALCAPDESPDEVHLGNFKSSSLLLIYFGQFLDHDMALVEVSNERADIVVDEKDDVLEEDLIFRRSLFVKDEDGTRQFENENTAYLDLSNIYGDTTERALALRKRDGSGLLKSFFRYDSQEYLPLFRDVFGDVFEGEELDSELNASSTTGEINTSSGSSNRELSEEEELKEETLTPLFGNIFGDLFAIDEVLNNSTTNATNPEINTKVKNMTRSDETMNRTSSASDASMENEVLMDENFACGDIRCNENPVLVAITTLWVRNHNRLAREYAVANPTADEDRIFYQARRRNIMMYQSIIYTEWLPALLGRRNMASYSSSYFRDGYQELLNPGSSVVFSTAAFRFGHSGIADTIVEASPDGKVLNQYRLAEVFFQPSLILASNVSLDSFLSGVRVLQHEALDTRIVDAIRNELFGNVDIPLDLAALNIQRGRDHGLNTFNAYRKSLGLEPYVDCLDYDDCWQALTQNEGLAAQLRQVYNNNFDAMDIFVAGMAEHKLGDSHLGETFTLLILQQFETFRHGDRFWYEHLNLESYRDVQLPATMTSVIEQNTQTYLESHLPAFVTQSLYLTMQTPTKIQLEWVKYIHRLSHWELVMEYQGQVVLRRNMGGSRVHVIVRRKELEMPNDVTNASYTIRLIGKLGETRSVVYRYWLESW